MKGPALDWSLEIVPKHIQHLHLIPGTINEIYVVMLPGSDVQNVVMAAKAILNIGKIPVPHIAARHLRSEEEFRTLLLNLKKAGANRALLIGGSAPRPNGPYHCAMDLFETGLLTKHGFKQIDIAGHPEGNPADVNAEFTLLQKTQWAANQKIKMRIITQWCFDPSVINSWIRRIRELKIENAVHVGIPGPATMKTLLHYAKICGVKASKMVLKKYGFSLTRLLFINNPDYIVNGLEGHNQLHLYPFGGLAEASKWLARQSR